MAQKLTNRNSITSVDGNTLIHVVKDNVSYKIRESDLFGNAIDTLETAVTGLSSGYQGILRIADTPTSDGYYLATESGTYTNAGSIIVDLEDGMTFINVANGQTQFYEIIIPVNALAYNIVYTLADFDSSIAAATSGQWIIADDIALDGNKTLPFGVTLNFLDSNIDLNTYTLTGDNTKINAGLEAIFSDNGTFAGTWDVKEVYPEWFSAVGDGTTDDTTSLQSCEDFADDTVIVFTKNYAISDNINKSSDVDWIGSGGKILKKDAATLTGNSKALVLADGVSNFTIKGLQFENVTRDRETGFMTSATSLGGMNTIIDVHNCTDFEISSNKMNKFAQGVIYRSCERFVISNNIMNSDNSKSISDYIDGTYTQISGSYALTGGINCGWITTDNDTASNDFTISNNVIEIPGLDVGIDGLSQNYSNQRGVITNNIIKGGNCGIQIYRGTFLDDGTAETYQGNLVLDGNSIYATWEQGIYVRGVIGVTVTDNTIERAACGAANGDGSGCSIVFRVNPFDGSVANMVSANNGDVYDDYGSICANNKIINHGTNTATNDPALQIEHNNVKVLGNTLTRSLDIYTTDQDTEAIFIGNGKKLRTVEIKDNTVLGIWKTALIYSDVAKTASFDDYCLITGNTFNGTFENGIEIRSYSINTNIDDNMLKGSYSSYAIFVRNAAIGQINNNSIHNAATAINIASGCLLSDINYYLSAGSITNSNRRGSSFEVCNNKLLKCTNTFTVTETNANDAYFSERLSKFENNYVDNVRYEIDFSGGTARSTFTPKTWAKHERCKNSNLSSGQVPYKICSASGQYGSSTTATGDTTSGSAVISNVSSLDGLCVGIFITTPNFTGTLKIIDVDVDNATITVDATANSTGSTQTLTPATPTFVSPAVIQ